MSESSAELARCLAERAEEVCRHYLSNGKREGHYWLVGDARNAKGRSLYVRLKGPTAGKGAAGKWTDAATDEHGDLLDIIGHVCQFTDHRDVFSEAQRFLGMSRGCWGSEQSYRRPHDTPTTAPRSTIAAQRLFAAAQPIAGTLAETYLRARGITGLSDFPSLRFHPRCFYRDERTGARQISPAMIAAVTDLGGAITGVQRTYLSRDGAGKAPMSPPRRALGQLLGHGVRFDTADDVMAAGEGVETMLSLRCAMARLPMIAALSAQHLAALELPPSLKRLYIAVDCDPAGKRAAETLRRHAIAIGVDAIRLTPTRNDFNDDLLAEGIRSIASSLRSQLAPDDIDRFLMR